MTHSQKIAFLKALPKETISPRELASVFGGDPYAFNIEAKKERLPFPHYWSGRNLKILKQPVIDMLIGRAA
ncbi:MAG: hypothetical protein K5784_05525 [Clostridiales bacterium]|nr:hypothetical protein [Clostridiales bacterium]